MCSLSNRKVWDFLSIHHQDRSCCCTCNMKTARLSSCVCLCVAQDFLVLYRYFSAGTDITLVFGCFQLAILLVGFLYQFWCTSFRKLFLATCESWNVGMPCNRLQKVLMKEKIIEAPLSLFLQFLSFTLYLFNVFLFGPWMPTFWLKFWYCLICGTKNWGISLLYIWMEAYFHCVSPCFRASLASPIAFTSPDT